MLKGGLLKLLFLLLSPAEVGTPEGKAVGDEHVEEANIEGEPPVVNHCGTHAPFALEKNVLHPCHQAGEDEVEDAHPAANFSQQATAVDIVQKQ